MYCAGDGGWVDLTRLCWMGVVGWAVVFGVVRFGVIWVLLRFLGVVDVVRCCLCALLFGFG